MGGTRVISHLIFANNFLIVTKANGRFLHAVKNVLDYFVIFLGLHIRPTKSLALLGRTCFCTMTLLERENRKWLQQEFDPTYDHNYMHIQGHNLLIVEF